MDTSLLKQSETIRRRNMNKKRTAIVTILMSGLLATGCVENTVRVNRNDLTYRATTHLVFQPGFADRSFSSSNDYMISTGFNGITYIWPQGKGNFSKSFNEIRFEGKVIKCTVVERRLTINGRPAGLFEEGDRVRITGDGKVFVNGEEQKSPEDT